MSTERKLRPGETRFVARSQALGRDVVWAVYDRQRSCFPVTVAGFGGVRQAMATEEEAQAEADRLAAFVNGTNRRTS